MPSPLPHHRSDDPVAGSSPGRLGTAVGDARPDRGRGREIADSTRPSRDVRACANLVALGDDAAAVAAASRAPPTPSSSPSTSRRSGARRREHMRVRSGAPAWRSRPRVVMRLNPLASGECDRDLEAVMAAAPVAVLLPATRGRADVERARSKLAVAEALNGIDDGTTAIVASLGHGRGPARRRELRRPRIRASPRSRGTPRRSRPTSAPRRAGATTAPSPSRSARAGDGAVCGGGGARRRDRRRLPRRPEPGLSDGGRGRAPLRLRRQARPRPGAGGRRRAVFAVRPVAGAACNPLREARVVSGGPRP